MLFWSHFLKKKKEEEEEEEEEEVEEGGGGGGGGEEEEEEEEELLCVLRNIEIWVQHIYVSILHFRVDCFFFTLGKIEGIKSFLFQVIQKHFKNINWYQKGGGGWKFFLEVLLLNQVLI